MLQDQVEAWAGQLAQELGLHRAEARTLLAKARQQWHSQQAARQQQQQLVLFTPAARAQPPGPGISKPSASSGAAAVEQQEEEQQEQQAAGQLDAKARLQELAARFAAQVQPALLADLCKQLNEAGPAACYAAAREWLLAAMQVAKHELWCVLRTDAGCGAGAQAEGGVRLLLESAGAQLGVVAGQCVREAAAGLGNAAC
jgi:hypothetical protein